MITAKVEQRSEVTSSSFKRSISLEARHKMGKRISELAIHQNQYGLLAFLQTRSKKRQNGQRLLSEVVLVVLARLMVCSLSTVAGVQF